MEQQELQILGFSISNFRSFGKSEQFIGPLKKFNIIVGENNSGKSNVCRFLTKIVIPYLFGAGTFSPDIKDGPQLSSNYPPRFVKILTKVDGAFLKILNVRDLSPQTFSELMNYFLQAFRPKTIQDYYWLPRANPNDKSLIPGDFLDTSIFEQTNENRHKVSSLWSAVTGSSGGNLDQHWIPEIIAALQRRLVKPLQFETIYAGRKIETALSGFDAEFGPQSTNAKTFIQQLAAYESPHYSAVADKEKWKKIENFVRTVMRNNLIKLHIPSTHDTINFDWDGKYLPIENLGTGVYQAILLAARATVLENQIICIEEPELHFHPELQRQIMHYLERETSNQYFITTHSAQIMDAVDACVISVTLEDGQSKISTPLIAQDRREVCHRLGYRPSDLLQSNCLIWVEGPSDRIYMNHWLKKLAPELSEGWHYSFSLYGGRVLSNFSAVDEDESAEEIEEFIKILPINRFAILVMDSDKRTEATPINASKERLRKEVTDGGGLAWVTAGREIENYLSHDVRLSAVKSVHKGAVNLAAVSADTLQWDHPLAFLDNSGKTKELGLGKVKISVAATKVEPDFSILDLGARLEEVIDFIRRANRMN